MARPRRLSAVALRYQPEAPFLDAAPHLVAKGQGMLAERILELAREHRIPVEQDADLLALLEPLDVNRMIPPELFQAVAILMATLYRANQTGSQRNSPLPR